MGAIQRMNGIKMWCVRIWEASWNDSPFAHMEPSGRFRTLGFTLIMIARKTMQVLPCIKRPCKFWKVSWPQRCGRCLHLKLELKVTIVILLYTLFRTLSKSPRLKPSFLTQPRYNIPSSRSWVFRRLWARPTAVFMKHGCSTTEKHDNEQIWYFHMISWLSSAKRMHTLQRDIVICI